MEDALIVDLYWQRDETAIAETQIKYERYLTKIAMNVLSDADDSMEAVNDTYLHAWNSMPPHRPSILSTFLGKITRRVSIDQYRKRTAAKRGGSEYEVSLQELSESGIEPGVEMENESEYKDLGKYISAYLRTLSEDSRNIFISRYFHFDPLKDICDNFGYSESKVKSVLFRAKGRLLSMNAQKISEAMNYIDEDLLAACDEIRMKGKAGTTKVTDLPGKSGSLVSVSDKNGVKSKKATIQRLTPYIAIAATALIIGAVLLSVMPSAKKSSSDKKDANTKIATHNAAIRGEVAVDSLEMYSGENNLKTPDDFSLNDNSLNFYFPSSGKDSDSVDNVEDDSHHEASETSTAIEAENVSGVPSENGFRTIMIDGNVFMVSEDGAAIKSDELSDDVILGKEIDPELKVEGINDGDKIYHSLDESYAFIYFDAEAEVYYFLIPVE